MLPKTHNSFVWQHAREGVATNQPPKDPHESVCVCVCVCICIDLFPLEICSDDALWPLLLTIEVVAIPKGVKVTHKGGSSSQVLFDFSNALTRMPSFTRASRATSHCVGFFSIWYPTGSCQVCTRYLREKKQCEALPKMEAIFLLK